MCVSLLVGYNDSIKLNLTPGQHVQKINLSLNVIWIQWGVLDSQWMLKTKVDILAIPKINTLLEDLVT